jgi:GRIP domain
LHMTRQQMAKKSSAAQRLLQEREAECAELRKTNKALQQEVDKGSFSDRRIFELAAKQSNRESLQASEIEIRDKAIERMKVALLERDGDLAYFESHVHEVEGQVEELCKMRRREDVNVDYLKSVVVQYLSLPPGSSERARLLPVLATLLQFNDGDYKTIEEGKQKLSWWGSVAPTFITAPGDALGFAASAPSPVPAAAAAPAAPSSAEVSVRKESAAPPANGKRTSLQF